MHPAVVRGMDLSQIKQPTTTHSSRKPPWLSSFSQNFSFSLLDQISAVDVFPKIRRRAGRELETSQKQTPEPEELYGSHIHSWVSESSPHIRDTQLNLISSQGYPYSPSQGHCPARTPLVKANNSYPEIRAFVV